MTGRLRDAFPVCHASNRKRLTGFEIIFSGFDYRTRASRGDAFGDPRISDRAKERDEVGPETGARGFGYFG
ncbi:hypothetical protein, partial [Pseudomonas ficuserectae]|uniref:hypothetical protein n=3 Tax=Pseudomonas syringae group genomosp. 2 TaxID=251698 RepID=UPI001C7E9633